MAVYYPVIFHHDGHVSELPPFLLDGSAWYGFQYVIYDLAKENPLKIKHVQDTWRPLQLRFFEQAEQAAEEANGMDADAADAMLRAVSLNISNTIQTTLLHLNSTLSEPGSAGGGGGFF